MKINFLEYEDNLQMGDMVLKTMCESLSKIPQRQKIIAIFDRDNDAIIKLHDGIIFKDWGNNVYSFCITKPESRKHYKKISIEFYYSDEEIKTPFDGKRLYFSNELEKVIKESPTSKKTNNTISILEKPNSQEECDKYIFDQDVNLIKDQEGNNVAHSKSVFAENILSEKAGFNNFGLNNFSLIFDLLKQILS